MVCYEFKSFISIKIIYLILNSTNLDLESEMYQLSHLLTEQRSLLAALASTSLLGSTNAGAATGGESPTDIVTQPDEQLQRDEEERRRKLTAALEKVEGCVVCAWLYFFPYCLYVSFLDCFIINFDLQGFN